MSYVFLSEQSLTPRPTRAMNWVEDVKLQGDSCPRLSFFEPSDNWKAYPKP